MNKKESMYNIKIDGYEIDTNDKKVVELVNYLLGKISFWKDISETYKMAINIMSSINRRGDPK